ncbi:4Fe-4S binding protein [Aggregatilinea lenta]|uniref:4Fe-4S binding protein n=1 Tax=Aggregatilinea lenta TaxID=913108 RepID=UPI000E5A9D5E|nr:4Fe-4S binding protein [Aggregatilinea lenta]
MLRKFALFLTASLAGLWLVGERGALLRPSTRRWMREAGGWRALLSPTWWHGYIYARWTNQYLLWAVKFVLPRTHTTPDHPLWADTYHAKILTTDAAKALVSINQDIPRCDLEQLIPFSAAREIVLSGPPDIAVYECPCRHARPNPCQPTQVCMVMGQPFVDFILEHNPDSSRRLTQAEALDLLQAEHERGHMHAAYFKDATLNRFYTICNCCKCCCAGIEAMVKHGVPMVISSGYVAQVDEMACTACGMCEDVCPFEAIEVEDVSTVAWEKCMGCGICAGQCASDAITLVLDARKGQPLDVHALIAASA